MKRIIGLFVMFTMVVSRWRKAKRQDDDVAETSLPMAANRGHAPTERISQPAASAAIPAPPRTEGQFLAQMCCHTGKVSGAVYMIDRPDLDLVDRMRDALAQMRDWDDTVRSLSEITLCAPRSLVADENLAQRVCWEIDRQEIAPKRVVIRLPRRLGPEIGTTEGLAFLRSFGVRIEFSVLDPLASQRKAIYQPGQLRLRIGKEFVRACHENPADAQQLLSLLAISDRLGATALAESVDHAEEHGFLAQLGCDVVQGQAVASAMDAERFSSFLALRRTAQEPLIPDVLRRGHAA